MIYRIVRMPHLFIPLLQRPLELLNLVPPVLVLLVLVQPALPVPLPLQPVNQALLVIVQVLDLKDWVALTMEFVIAKMALMVTNVIIVLRVILVFPLVQVSTSPMVLWCIIFKNTFGLGCECSMEGTASCHVDNGQCSCLEGYFGDQCQHRKPLLYSLIRICIAVLHHTSQRSPKVGGGVRQLGTTPPPLWCMYYTLILT